MKRLGFIGYGLRSETMMKAFRAIEADITVSAIVDPRQKEIVPLIDNDPMFGDVRWYESADDMINQADLDGIFIGTRCSLHSELACKVLSADIPLFLEKPVCINYEQYHSLREASRGKESSVVVSFPLRLSPVVTEMRRIASSGILGKITMVQAINNVPYGSVYYHSWYRNPAETGGLFMQKATHDVDYILSVIGELPVTVYATSSKIYYQGTHKAGLKCPDCPELRTCVESSYYVRDILKEDVTGESCCFAVDTGNDDCYAAIFRTEQGMIITYSQNFIIKKSAARRGARFIGTEASAEFDFYTNQIRIDHYRTAETESRIFNVPTQHFGGDEKLAIEFMNVLDGKKSESDLNAGLNSAACCLAASQSSKTHNEIHIPY